MNDQTMIPAPPSPFSYDPHSEHAVNPFDRLKEPQSNQADADSPVFLGLDLSTQVSALRSSQALSYQSRSSQQLCFSTCRRH